MTLLSLIQDVADLIALPRPVVVANSNDPQVRQLLALANIEGKSLSRRYQWQALDKTATFTTIADIDQGAVSTIAPGFQRFINSTFWDRTQQYPLIGPSTPQDWQMQVAITATGPYYNFRIQDGHLLMYPEPSAGDTIAFEYESKYWCQSSGGTPQDAWEADTDTGILDEYLMTLGVRWRFLQAKGLNYGEAFRQYEREVFDAMGRDGAKKKLRMDNGPMNRFPDVRAPDGSWNL